MILSGTGRRPGAVLAPWLLAAAALAVVPPPAAAEPLPSLERLAEADTVRTNLWLAQALMAEIVREAAAALPPAPDTVVLEPRDVEPPSELFTVVAGRVLREMGYTVAIREPRPARGPSRPPGGTGAGSYPPGDEGSTTAPAEAESDTTGAVEAAEPRPPGLLGTIAGAARQHQRNPAGAAPPPADRAGAPRPGGADTLEADASAEGALLASGHTIRYRLERTDLAYPEVGRLLGIWRQWVERRLEVAALVTVVEAGSGRVLLSDRLVRTFGDRLPGGRLDAVRSSSYSFTDAKVQESGWRRRLEEIVVIGTLTALVAVYFANTGD